MEAAGAGQRCPDANQAHEVADSTSPDPDTRRARPVEKEGKTFFNIPLGTAGSSGDFLYKH